MSRIAKVPIKLPKGVQVSVGSGMVVSLKGPKGEATVDTRNHVVIRQEDGSVWVDRKSDDQQDRAFHGLYHRLITSAIVGLTQGYTRELELQGVGYRAEMQGKVLVLSVGRSHQVRYDPKPGIKIDAPKQTQVIITGTDKQAVHQAAAEIRGVCPPEPYKGKGIRYFGEVVRKKVGKTGTK